MTPFERHNVAHLSASSLNLWLAAPSLWVMEKLLKLRTPVGCAAHRGTAVEAGVSVGLFDPAHPADACVEEAYARYDRLAALSGDPRRDDERKLIAGMVRQGLELRAHGAPIRPNQYDQHRVEITLPDLPVPFVGYLDWMFADEVIDLKTTQRVPSAMSEPHLRQATIYKTAHMDRRVRFFYVSDKRSEKHTLTREQYDQALREITGATLRLQRFLSLSDDAHELAQFVPHSSESFYFNDPKAKAMALETYGY